MAQFKKWIIQLLPAIAIFSISLIVFRELLVGISTRLLDWNDYPFIVWVVFQNLGHFSHIQLHGIFNTNIFYPFQGTLLFSETFLLQSAFGAFITIFWSNPITVFNLIFFSTLFLNACCSYLLWKRIFSSNGIAFFGGLITSLSPFFFLMIGHYQMMMMWPIFLGLYLLFSRKQWKSLWKLDTLVGLLCGLLFYGSVYLSLMMVVIVGLFYGGFALYEKRVTDKIIYFIKGVVFFSFSFFLVAGPLVYKYASIVKMYNIVRPQSEYVQYAAHITDYLFSNYSPSFINSLPVMLHWNTWNHHMMGESAAFPSFTLLFLGMIGFFQIHQKKQQVQLLTSFGTQELFFALLLLTGLIFSLGPRLSVNGVYFGIPLPFYAVMKAFPLVLPIRATARWSFLFYLGLSFFALKGLRFLIQKQSLRTITIMSASVFLFIAEVIPMKISATERAYYPSIYNTVADFCRTEPKVLLELPMTQTVENNSVVSNLSYRTSMQLASIQHKCLLVNGYSGYFPDGYAQYEEGMREAFRSGDIKIIRSLLDMRNVSLLKINMGDFGAMDTKAVSAQLEKLTKLGVLQKIRSENVQSIYLIVGDHLK